MAIKVNLGKTHTFVSTGIRPDYSFYAMVSCSPIIKFCNESRFYVFVRLNISQGRILGVIVSVPEHY